ncbi:MAG TPA: diguanylate cyclase [Acidimicrobiales bacterium]|nr:diguanylate cyclase [Acidimicrobiales bacterium]
MTDGPSGADSGRTTEPPGGPSDASDGPQDEDREPHFPTLAALLSRVLGAARRDTLDVAVETCLEHLGRFAEADMAFTMLIDDDERMSHDWRWVRPGESYRGPGIGTPLGDLFGSSIELLRLGHTIVVADLDRIDISPFERAAARLNDLRGILIAPVRVGTTLLGICGLQVYHHPRQWEPSCVNQVELLSGLLVQGVTRSLDRGALALADARARRIAEFIPEGLALLDRDGVIQWASPVLARMTGLPASRLEGTAAADLAHPSDRDELAEALRRASARTDHLAVRMRSGEEWRWSELTWRVVAEPDSGVPDELVLTVRDEHERIIEYRELATLAQQDQLTGAANRAALERRMGELAGDDADVLFLFCDLDGFKSVNDTHGHHVGDTVLGAVAQAMRSVVRADDLVARVGGDEFAIVVSPPGDPAPLGDRLLTAVRLARDVAGGVGVSVSIGIAGPARADDDGLRRMADAAMYEAKRLGKDCWVHLGPAGDRRASRAVSGVGDERRRTT